MKNINVAISQRKSSFSCTTQPVKISYFTYTELQPKQSSSNKTPNVRVSVVGNFALADLNTGPVVNACHRKDQVYLEAHLIGGWQ